MKWSVFTLSDIRRVKPRMNALYKTTNDSFTRLLRFQEFYNVEISKSRSVNLEKNSRIFPVYYLQSVPIFLIVNSPRSFGLCLTHQTIISMFHSLFEQSFMTPEHDSHHSIVAFYGELKSRSVI